MGIFKSSKNVAGKLVDVRVDKWMSWDYISETSDRFKILLLDIFIPKKATHAETFEEALERLELTEDDLEQRKIEFTRLFYFFVVLSIIIIVYGLYLAIFSSLIPALIAFCLSLYTLTQAFRFHFWLFQIKNRKLGCTVKEWFNAKVEPETTKELTLKKSRSKIKPKQHDSSSDRVQR